MIGGDPSSGTGPSGQGNVVGGNGDCGIGLWDHGVAFNTITGNSIGTDATGKHALGNGGADIAIARSASNNVIGPGNTIAHNGGVGIEVGGGDSRANTTTKNTIHRNAGPGILLHAGGNAEIAEPETVW